MAHEWPAFGSKSPAPRLEGPMLERETSSHLKRETRADKKYESSDTIESCWDTTGSTLDSESLDADESASKTISRATGANEELSSPNKKQAFRDEKCRGDIRTESFPRLPVAMRVSKSESPVYEARTRCTSAPLRDRENWLRYR